MATSTSTRTRKPKTGPAPIQGPALQSMANLHVVHEGISVNLNGPLDQLPTLMDLTDDIQRSLAGV